MIISLLAGIIVGFVLAIPPGPVAVTAMRVGLENGKKNGTLVGLGTGTMDFVYCTMAIFATSAALLLIESYTEKYPLVVLILQLLIVMGIVIYGITHLKPQKNLLATSVEPISRKSGFFDNLAHKGPVFLGLAIALANIANPSFMSSLAYVTMNVQKLGMIDNTALGKVSFAFGFGVGNFFWLYVLLRLVIYYKPKMSDKFMSKIQKFAGVTLIGFGTLLGFRILELTKWSEILRFVFAF